jgi:hypothetical protein
VQLHRGHGALEAQQQLVVEVPQIVDAIGIGDKGVVTWQNSSRRWKSAEFRDSRDASRTSTSPASPWQTLLTTSLKSLRSAMLRPDSPRSPSRTSTCDRSQPRQTAASASAYWRMVDSVCSRTWAAVDWRR